MADSGLCQFISYLLNLVRYDNGSASNAISAQISKTLGARLLDRLDYLERQISVSWLNETKSLYRNFCIWWLF